MLKLKLINTNFTIQNKVDDINWIILIFNNEMRRITLIIIVIILIAAAVWVLTVLFGLWQGRSGQQINGEAGQVPRKFAVEETEVEIVRLGQGLGAQAGDFLTVEYVAMLEDGKEVDSTYDRGVPFRFELGAEKVIKGWDLGLVGMKIDEKRKLTIPPEMAYGALGLAIAGIPPNATLIYEIELLGISTP